MSSKQTRTRQSEPDAGERERPRRESAGADMKQTMAEMMAHCQCGPGMMTNIARLLGGCGPSKPAEPTQGKP